MSPRFASEFILAGVGFRCVESAILQSLARSFDVLRFLFRRTRSKRNAVAVVAIGLSDGSPEMRFDNRLSAVRGRDNFALTAEESLARSYLDSFFTSSVAIFAGRPK